LDRAKPVGAFLLPSPEALIGLEFPWAVNPWRNRDRRARDIVDLRTVYHAVGPGSLDRRLTPELGGLAFPGSEGELEEMLDRIDRGEPIVI